MLGSHQCPCTCSPSTTTSQGPAIPKLIFQHPLLLSHLVLHPSVFYLLFYNISNCGPLSKSLCSFHRILYFLVIISSSFVCVKSKKFTKQSLPFNFHYHHWWSLSRRENWFNLHFKILLQVVCRMYGSWSESIAVWNQLGDNYNIPGKTRSWLLLFWKYLRFERKFRKFLVSAPTCKDLGNSHSCPYKKEKLIKLKVKDFLGPIEEHKLQGKLPSPNLRRQVNPETHSWNVLTGSHKLIEMLNHYFWQDDGGWVWTNIRVRNSCDPDIMGLTSRNPTAFSQLRPRKIHCGSGRGRPRIHCEISPEHASQQRLRL